MRLARRLFLRRALGAFGSLPVLVAAACNPAAPTRSGATTAGTGAAGTTGPATGGSLVPLRIAVVGSGFSVYVAGNALGTFERDGLAVDILDHRGGAEAAQALVGGGVDIFNGDFSHAIRLNQHGQQVRVVAGVTERHGYSLMGLPGVPHDVSAVRRKKIGISSPGSQTDTSMRWLMKTRGLDPEKDAELIAIGAGASMMAALQAQQVFGGMLSQPFTAQAKLQQYGPIFDFAEELGPYQANVMMARQDFLQAHGETLRLFLRSYLGVVAALYDDPATRAQVEQAVYGKLDPRVASAAVAAQIQAYPRDGRVNPEAVARVFEFDQVAREDTRPVPALSEFSDFSYLPSASG